MTGKISLTYSAEGEAILSFHTYDKLEARGTYQRLKDQLADATFKKHKGKRSSDANAYAWVLIDKIAAATGVPREEVYRNAIRQIGGVSTLVCVRKKDASRIMNGWKHNGLGWQVETMPSQLPECINLILYCGSSVYDTEQMSRLIDSLVQDCQALEIETLSPNRLSAMMGMWDERTRAM